MFGKKKENTGDFIHTTDGKIYLANYKTHEPIGNGKVLVDKGLKSERVYQVTYSVPSSKPGFFKRLFGIKAD